MPQDRFGRPLRSLRVSVTDRCNLRCRYCMPEEDYAWLPRGDLLTFEEVRALAEAFVLLGVDRLRLTGGEPLLRRDLPRLVQQLAGVPGITDLALTTNGTQLVEQAPALVAAGLSRITVSLDTLDPARFQRLTGRTGLERVLAGLAAAGAAGFPRGVKLNTVVMLGFNDDELSALVELARRVPAEPRFIEYMDVGGATRWSEAQVLPQAEILARLAARYGEPTPLPVGSAPARRYRLPDGLCLGVIASTTAPFCGGCDRARLTADGTLYLCLYGRSGLDLRTPLRRGAGPEELAALVRQAWEARSERGAEERLRLASRRIPLARVEELRADPHLEMHKRGG